MTVERHPDCRVYVTGPDGIVHRVHDVVFRAGRHVRFPLGDHRATTRLFVPQDPEGWLRPYTFTAAEEREPTAAALARQLLRAEFSRRNDSFDSAQHGRGHLGG